MRKQSVWLLVVLALVAGSILAYGSLFIEHDDWSSIGGLALLVAAGCRLYYREDESGGTMTFAGGAILAALIIGGPYVGLWAAALGNFAYHFVRSRRVFMLSIYLCQDVILGWIAFEAFTLLGGEWGPAFNHPIQALAMAIVNMVAGSILFTLMMKPLGREVHFAQMLRALLNAGSIRAGLLTMFMGILVAFAYLKGGLTWALTVAGLTYMISNTLYRYFETLGHVRSQAQQLAAVLDATQGALIHTDERGLIQVANRQVGVLLDVEPDTLINKPADEVSELVDIRTQIESQGERIDQVIELARGSARFIHWYRSALLDKQGEVKGHVEVFTDVTPLKEAEQRLRLLHDSMIRALTAAIDARDSYTHGHSSRVSEYSVAIAKEMGVPAPDVERIGYSGLLHDIGKLGIDDRILGKHGALSPSERALMMQHPVIGAEVLEKAQVLTDLIPGVRWHHEWLSGGGYPDRLKGDEIPLDARIIGCADAFDAMTTDRPYRPAMPVAEALGRIMASAGVQFDPLVAAALKRAIESGAIHVANRQNDLPVLPESSPEGEGYIKPVHGKELSILYQLSREDFASLSLEALLHRYLETFYDIIGPNIYMIYLINPTTDELELRSVVGLSDQGLAARKDLQTVRKAMDTAAPIIIDHLGAIEGYQPAGTDAKSEAAIPLVSQNEVFGCLVVEAALPDFFRKDDLYLLEAIAQQLCSSVKLARYHERLAFAANHDGLTNVYNHGYFYERLTDEVTRAERYGRSVSVILLDLNGMKAINDTHGHLAGDVALREYGHRLQGMVRTIDVVARYGGDEFAIILPETDKAEAVDCVKRLMKELQRTFTYNGIKIPLPTAGWGVASFPEDGQRATELVYVADRAMYKDKHSATGRVPRGGHLI